MKREKKIKILKLILLCTVILIFTLGTIYLFPVMKSLNTYEGQQAFKERVGDGGVPLMLALFGLQFLQILLIFVPGEPVEVLCGMFYGGAGGAIFVTISAAIISTTIFLLVRKFGRKFVYDFCDKEKIKKLENNKLFSNPKKLINVLIILYIIPGTPKDLISYLSGLLPIDPLDFILISTFARFPSVISSTFAGANLATGDLKMSIIVYAVTFLIVGVLMFIFRLFDKDKISDDIMKM